MVDIPKSHCSDKHLTDITKSVTSNLKNAGFHYAKFTSNSQDLIDQLPSSEIMNHTSISQ